MNKLNYLSLMNDRSEMIVELDVVMDHESMKVEMKSYTEMFHTVCTNGTYKWSINMVEHHRMPHVCNPMLCNEPDCNV